MPFTADYVITLKNDKSVLYNRMGILFILVNILYFIFLAFYTSEKKIQTGSLAIAVLLVPLLLLHQYFKRANSRFGLHPYSFLIILGWINAGVYWMVAIVIILDLLHTAATMKKLVLISESSIIFPSFPSKKIQWSALNNLILKDGLLTIDFKNNRIIQQLTDETSGAVNEKEFNDFCRQQLNR
jgi:hypothetical protein